MMNRAIFSSICFWLTVAMAAVAPGCAGAGDPIEGDRAVDPVEGDRVRDPVVDDNKEAVGEESLAVSVKCPTACVTFSCDCDGKDARVWSRPDQRKIPAPNVLDFTSMAWTWDGVYGVVRPLIEFDLSTIPNYSTILSATLNLYGMGGHSSLSNSNASYLFLVGGPWAEATVVWDTQPPILNPLGPPFIPYPMAILPASNPAAPAQSYAVNVKDMVQYWMDHPGSNHGFEMRLQVEEKYAELQFASCDNTTTARPSLTVCWKAPTKKPSK